MQIFVTIFSKTRRVGKAIRERTLVTEPSGNYGTIYTSGASGGNFYPATYCTRGLFSMIIMYAYDDQ
jgi:hypothetical protein